MDMIELVKSELHEDSTVKHGYAVIRFDGGDLELIANACQLAYGFLVDHESSEEEIEEMRADHGLEPQSKEEREEEWKDFREFGEALAFLWRDLAQEPIENLLRNLEILKQYEPITEEDHTEEEC